MSIVVGGLVVSSCGFLIRLDLAIATGVHWLTPFCWCLPFQASSASPAEFRQRDAIA
jgi:hypothetical protein